MRGPANSRWGDRKVHGKLCPQTRGWGGRRRGPPRPGAPGGWAWWWWGRTSAGRRWPVRIVLASPFSLTLQQRPQGLGKFRSWAGGRSDPRAPGGSFLLPQKSGLQRAQGCERTRLPMYVCPCEFPCVCVGVSLWFPRESACMSLYVMGLLPVSLCKSSSVGCRCESACGVSPSLCESAGVCLLQCGSM